jgi:hypothetical protein
MDGSQALQAGILGERPQEQQQVVQVLVPLQLQQQCKVNKQQQAEVRGQDSQPLLHQWLDLSSVPLCLLLLAAAVA